MWRTWAQPGFPDWSCHLLWKVFLSFCLSWYRLERSTSGFLVFKLYLFTYWGWGHMWKPEDNFCRSQFSPPTLWVPEIELRSSAWQQLSLPTRPSSWLHIWFKQNKTRSNQPKMLKSSCVCYMCVGPGEARIGHQTSWSWRPWVLRKSSQPSSPQSNSSWPPPSHFSLQNVLLLFWARSLPSAHWGVAVGTPLP